MTVTLATLSQATAQEVFNQVLNHARVQGKASKDEGGGCYYRNPEGLACFAGCLISDDEYIKQMDGGDSTWNGIFEKGYVPRDHFDLIRSLQSIHDDYQPSDWEGQFKKLANYENLVYKEIV